jgi:agmatine deiminase
MSTSPSAAGFRQPGEWTPHRACWLAFPSDPDLWPSLPETQAVFTRLCRAIAAPAAGAPGERLEILVRDPAAGSQAQGLLAGLPAHFHEFAFGDIWMRDIAPIFLRADGGNLASVRFRFNGWGGKYDYPGDSQVAERVQALTPFARFASELVLEGGAVECDGAGLCLTTRDVALNPNRNPGLSEADVEQHLCAALGATRVLWLGRGLLNDHTDGHIDNIARFIGPGRVVCMRAQTSRPAISTSTSPTAAWWCRYSGRHRTRPRSRRSRRCFRGAASSPCPPSCCCKRAGPCTASHSRSRSPEPLGVY